MKQFIYLSMILLFFNISFSQKKYTLKSPNQNIEITITISDQIFWSVKHTETVILKPSEMAMELLTGEILGKNPEVVNIKNETINTSFETPFYKKKKVLNHYNSLIINFKKNFSIEYRAFNDGVAYRFITARKEPIIIKNEEVNINFENDCKTLIPYVRDLRNPKDQYICAFEALYEDKKVSEFSSEALGFLPFLAQYQNNKKAVFLEADLEDYPGMYIVPSSKNKTAFKGKFPQYPLEEFNGGFNNINLLISKRANYLVQTKGTRTFPWRAIVISQTDKDLANNDMVQKLASPSRITNTSWIKPGKVAWDWWNDWNIYNVDFKAGINTQTYKYYIDFASANKLEYVIIDEGWSADDDLMKLNEKLDVKELINYGKQKNVGIILWASWYALTKNTETVFKNYANIGVKGFKVDFMDRDDAKMVTSLYQIAQKAAQEKLLLDYHGMYKPTGLQRTFPNILNFEGVKGLENSKWTPNDDVPNYDCTIPYIRMMAGPMDYTPGAMRNAIKSDFRFNHSMPMSQGTRCHQLAMYTIFEAPLQMLADSPTAYIKEQESTDFIAKIPTIFDETIAIDGSVGNYIVIARKKDNIWHIGALSNWEERDIEIDFSFLDNTIMYQATVFKDGLNANKVAADYKKESITINSKSKIKFHLANGGGLAIQLNPIK